MLNASKKWGNYSTLPHFSLCHLRHRTALHSVLCSKGMVQNNKKQSDVIKENPSIPLCSAAARRQTNTCRIKRKIVGMFRSCTFKMIHFLFHAKVLWLWILGVRDRAGCCFFCSEPQQLQLISLDLGGYIDSENILWFFFLQHCFYCSFLWRILDGKSL